MDKKLQIVQGLYESGVDGQFGHPGAADEEPEMLREYQAMSQAKFWMDHRRPERPDTATVDRIVEAAAKASAGELPSGVRSERVPLRLFQGTPFRVAIAAAVAMIAISLGLWRTGADEPPAPQPEEQAMEDVDGNRRLAERPAAAPAPAATVDRLSALEKEEGIGTEFDEIASAGAVAVGQAKDSAVFGRRANEPAAPILARTALSSVPEWGHPDELVQIKQRIEQLKARNSDLGWDKPLVPLEMVPGSGGDTAIRQAGAKQD